MKDKLPCFMCEDGHYEPISQLYEATLPDGNTLSVPDIDVLTCVKCGDECLDSENSKKIDEARNMKVEERNEAERYKKNLYRQLDNVNQVKQEVAHIQSPYSLSQILDLYCKGDYNAELLLQHSLRILINNYYE